MAGVQDLPPDESIEEKPSSPFCNPIYKQISKKNGEINKMKYKELKKALKELNLSGATSGDIMRKKLKTYYREKFLHNIEITEVEKPFPYYIIIDFEATSDGKKNETYMHEIIEFPAVLIDSNTLEILDKFQSFVKPVIHPKLSDFIINLTSITQDMVDGAPTFPAVLAMFENWMATHQITRNNSIIVTDGPCDLGKFFYQQIKISSLKFPNYAKRWVNIQRSFSNFYHFKRPHLLTMLTSLKMKFEGRQHRGIDDATNISRILIHMLRDGARVEANERIDLSTIDSKSPKSIRQTVKRIHSSANELKAEDYYTAHGGEGEASDSE